MMLGEAVAGLRIGDIDGYEDTARRKALDAMGFVWGKNHYVCIHIYICMYVCIHIYEIYICFYVHIGMSIYICNSKRRWSLCVIKIVTYTYSLIDDK
jgi:hypothetical protein